MNYYNDNDRSSCHWLRALIAARLIPEGKVDERSICDLRAEDLVGFSHVCLFAGIGGWQRALDLAGWPPDREVWTGSCPCQPYSAAGKRQGDSDERNLWPEMFRLVRECCPATVFGEQVAAAIGHGWLDRVFADLEGESYACAAAVLPACSVGAPHIRQRLFWVANLQSGAIGPKYALQARQPDRGSGCLAERLGESSRSGLQRRTGLFDDDGEECAASQRAGYEPGGVGNAEANGLHEQSGNRGEPTSLGLVGFGEPASDGRNGGFWSDYEWLYCRDEKFRRFQGSQSEFCCLANGIWYNLAGLLPLVAEKAKERVMGYAKSCNKQPGEVLRMVQEAYAEKTLSTARRLGMQQEFPEKEILFSFLLCVSSALDGTSFGSSSKEKSVQDGEKGVRGVWDYLRDVGSPFRRESQEQRTIESPDPLFVLSWFLAQGAKEVAEANARSNAATFPLAERTSGRVAVLRGLGNSIVPQVAAEFIAAFLEAEEDLKGL